MFVKNKLELKNLWGQTKRALGLFGFRKADLEFLILRYFSTTHSLLIFFSTNSPSAELPTIFKIFTTGIFWSKCIILRISYLICQLRNQLTIRGWTNNHAWNYLPESHKYTSRQESGPILSNLVCKHCLYSKTNIDDNWKISN